MCRQHSARRSLHVTAESRLASAYSAQGNMLHSLNMMTETRQTRACAASIFRSDERNSWGNQTQAHDRCTLHIVQVCSVLLHLDIMR